MHYLLYTDGAYYPDHERSAISYVMINAKTKREERRLSQTVKGETSGRAEIKAIISAVYALPSDADSCTIISDRAMPWMRVHERRYVTIMATCLFCLTR